jgi:hypothetical protein
MAVAVFSVASAAAPGVSTAPQRPFVIGGHSWDSQQAFVESGARCATREITAEEAVRVEQRLGPVMREIARYRAAGALKKPEVTPGNGGNGGNPGGGPGGGATAVDIPVWSHVMHDGETGKLGSSDIRKQIDTLRESYGGAGWTFTLAGTTYSNNADWFNGIDQAAVEAQVKSALRQGGASTLNIYSASQSGRRTTGLGHLPLVVRGQPDRRWRRDPVFLDSWRCGGALQRGRHGGPRGGSLARPVPHVPGRLLDQR